MSKEINKSDPLNKTPEVNVLDKLLKRSIDGNLEIMYEEDLAALRSINENNVLELLEYRMASDKCYTFVGDILLFLNPNEKPKIFGKEVYEDIFSWLNKNIQSRITAPNFTFYVIDKIIVDKVL